MIHKTLIFLCLFFSYSSLSADPWGKDADLTMPPRKSYERSSHSIISSCAQIMVRFHQKVISPTDGPRSHYIPSSSTYTLASIRINGFFKGFLLGCDRLLRENSDPWVYPIRKNHEGDYLKYDPPPIKQLFH